MYNKYKKAVLIVLFCCCVVLIALYHRFERGQYIEISSDFSNLALLSATQSNALLKQYNCSTILQYRRPVAEAVFTFNLSNLLNDMIQWKYRAPAIIVGGSSCSGTGSATTIFRHSNHFMAEHTAKEPRFFTTHCMPHAQAAYNRYFVAAESQWNYLFSTAFPEFVINESWSIIPWDISDSECTQQAWDEYVDKIGLGIDPTRPQNRNGNNFIAELQQRQQSIYESEQKPKQKNNNENENESEKSEYPYPIKNNRSILNHWHPSFKMITNTNDSNDSHVNMNIFYADLSPQYIHRPIAAKSISLITPHTKLVFMFRERMSVTYCRLNKLSCLNPGQHVMKTQSVLHASKEDCINRAFINRNERFIQSKIVAEHLMPLLRAQPQTARIRDQIIAWMVSAYAWKLKYNNLPMDTCPYINTLLWMKNAARFNHVYGSAHFKVVQFEYFVTHMRKMSFYFYCFVVYDRVYTDNECVTFLMTDPRAHAYVLEHQFWMQTEAELSHQAPKYNKTFSHLTTFDALSQFHSVCDMRLFELLQEYPQLILGQFNIQQWFDKRAEWRRQIIDRYY